MTDFINWLIKVFHCDTNKISDGYHTFEDLYEHRIALFIALCRATFRHAWKSQLHSDGTKYEGWFILGITWHDSNGLLPSRQITYHLPMKYWDEVKDIATLDKAPEWDGHTPQDVIDRLLTIEW